MQKSKFKIFVGVLTSLFAVNYTLFTRTALAHCPLCVAGAAAGVTLTRWVGIDDSITGIWIAALLGAMSFWLEPYVFRLFKKTKKDLIRPLLYILILGATLWSFYQFNLVIRMSQIFGVDKLTFGMITGGILFYFVDLIDDAIIQKNEKVFFPYQRIVVSLGSMVIWSLLVYILINFVI
jgi:hypothetical protein